MSKTDKRDARFVVPKQQIVVKALQGSKMETPIELRLWNRELVGHDCVAGHPSPQGDMLTQGSLLQR
jgi:hypothetical protein